MKYDELQRRQRRRKKREEKIKRENEAGRDLRPSRRAGSQHPSRGRSGKLYSCCSFSKRTQDQLDRRYWKMLRSQLHHHHHHRRRYY